MAIIQGGNSPIILELSNMTTGTITSASATLSRSNHVVKRWLLHDMVIEGAMVTLPLTQQETLDLDNGVHVIEFKYMLDTQDVYLSTQEKVSVESRNNKSIVGVDAQGLVENTPISMSITTNTVSNGDGGGSGTGENGATFIPKVTQPSNDSITLSWSNDGGLENPAPVTVTAPKGDKGDTGEQGAQGLKGDTGEKGDKGDTGEQGLKGDKGDKGDTGEKGADGADGLTTQITVNNQVYTQKDGNITLPNYPTSTGGAYNDTEVRELITQNANDIESLENSKADKTQIPDVSGFATHQQLQDLDNAKQDTLVSGTNIKTINGQPILGEGDIEVVAGSGGSASAVLYTEQSLTDAQMSTACLNMGASNTELKSTWKTGAMSTSGVESVNETRAISDYMPTCLQFDPPAGYAILGAYYYDDSKNFLFYETKGSVKVSVPIAQKGAFVKITLQSSPTKTLTQDDLDFIRYNATFKVKYITVAEDEVPRLIRQNKPTQSLQLKCAMDTTSDLFQPNTCMYLWFEVSTNRFFISYDLKGKKEYAFEWTLQDTPDHWSMAFTGYGDILCVYNSAMSDSPRTINPIVLERAKAYAATSVFLSADKPKPYGWFANHGFTRDDVVNAVAGEYYIAEYTRTNTDRCIWWHIDGAPTSNTSWNIVKEYTLSGSDNNGMKHFHGTQVDPWTGYKYAFTGDDDTASYVLVTKDNGVTNEIVYGPDETRCRLLNYVFTKNSVYWGTDSAVEGKCLFFKATRDENGVIDIANAETLHNFTGLDTYATYATIYMEALNCIVILLRSDGVTEMECPIYIWDLNDNMMKIAGTITSATGNGTGFRCRYYDRTPKNNYFALSWDTVADSNFAFPNPNKVLNNIYNQIYTLILTISRVGDGFTVTYDTVK